MTITQEQVKTIRQELNSMKPDVTKRVNQELTIKQTIMALAPTLERMKKRGFELAEIVSRLHEKGIEIKPQTPANGTENRMPSERPKIRYGTFEIKPDIPLDEL